MDGNYYARRKFALMGNLLEHIGVERDRVHFSWISSAEATKFVDVVKEISNKVKELEPNKKFVKDYN
ncbi:MAG: hydrogenase iron-sulfur subunit [Proteobacteria bacterium]|nr:hydrogenase iron-sulfur subunit [Pseudomonadota bacterium]